MDVVYALEDPPETIVQSIFLAGPTPRDAETPSWRPEALRLLEAIGYDGVVFVPEDRSGVYHGNYDGQVMWEDMGLNMADIILFWVPRNMQNMPALTTNVEFGRWESSGKMSFGAPADAEKNTYLQYYVDKIGAPTATTLLELIQQTVEYISPGISRSGGDRYIPRHIWNTPHFQRWHANLTAARQSIKHGQLTWYQPSGSSDPLWALQLTLTSAHGEHQQTLVSQSDVATVALYNLVNGIQHVIVDPVMQTLPTVEVGVDATVAVHKLVLDGQFTVVEHGTVQIHPHQTSQQHLLSAQLDDVQWQTLLDQGYQALSSEYLDRLSLVEQSLVIQAMIGD